LRKRRAAARNDWSKWCSTPARWTVEREKIRRCGGEKESPAACGYVTDKSAFHVNEKTSRPRWDCSRAPNAKRATNGPRIGCRYRERCMRDPNRGQLARTSSRGAGTDRKNRPAGSAPCAMSTLARNIARKLRKPTESGPERGQTPRVYEEQSMYVARAVCGADEQTATPEIRGGMGRVLQHGKQNQAHARREASRKKNTKKKTTQTKQPPNKTKTQTKKTHTPPKGRGAVNHATR